MKFVKCIQNLKISSIIFLRMCMKFSESYHAPYEPTLPEEVGQHDT